MVKSNVAEHVVKTTCRKEIFYPLKRGICVRILGSDESECIFGELMYLVIENGIKIKISFTTIRFFAASD